MGFTERQKSELRLIYQESSKEMVSNLISDSSFIQAMANAVADVVTRKISTRLDKMNGDISSLQTGVSNIQGQNEELQLKVDCLEQKLKLDKLRVYGIKEGSEDDLRSGIEKILSEKLGIDDSGVEFCRRLGGKRGAADTTSKPRPVLVTFKTVHDRNQIFYNKKNLKGTKIVITEELTKCRYDLLMLARDKFGRGNAWSRQGDIFAKAKGSRVLLKSEEDIAKLS